MKINNFILTVSIVTLLSGCYVTNKKKDLIETEFENKIHACMLDKPLNKPVLENKNNDTKDYVKFAKELVKYTESLETITEECVTLKKNNFRWVEIKSITK